MRAFSRIQYAAATPAWLPQIAYALGARRTMGIRVLLMVLGLAVASSDSHAETFYVSSPGGSVSCNGGTRLSQTVSYFNNAANWATAKTSGKIGPGDVVYVCGTLTFSAGATGFFFQASGSSGSPITLMFDTGALLQAPYFYSGGNKTGGAVNFNGQSWVVLDGGASCGYNPATNTTTACNGTIQNTANGTGMAYRAATMLVEMANCSNCEVRNMYLRNMYQRSGTAAEVDAVVLTAINAIGTTNDKVHHNVIDMGGWCVYGVSNFYNNDIGNCEHHVQTAPTTLFLHDNHFHDWGLWDSPPGGNGDPPYHHDGLHCFAGSGGAVQTMYVYNNLFDGTTGNQQGMNQFIFIEGVGSPTTCMLPGGTAYVFNNIFVAASTLPAFGALYGNATTGDSGDLWANNTGIGAGPSSNTFAMRFQNTANLRVYNNASSSTGWLIADSVNVTYSAVDGSAVDGNAYQDCAGNNCFSAACTNNCGGTGNFTVWQATNNCGGRCDANGKANLSSSAYFALDSNRKPLASSPLIRSGMNLTRLCTGNLAPLCSDFTGRPRPAIGQWDIGAYQYASGNGPAPPSDLSALVH